MKTAEETYLQQLWTRLGLVIDANSAAKSARIQLAWMLAAELAQLTGVSRRGGKKVVVAGGAKGIVHWRKIGLPLGQIGMTEETRRRRCESPIPMRIA